MSLLLLINKKNQKFWFQLLWKLFLLLIVVTILFFGFYFDRKIRILCNKGIHHFPAAVYSRIVSLRPKMFFNKTAMIKLLEATQYCQVKQIAFPGEFSIQENSIEVVRRPFSFPDKSEEEIRARFIFSGNYLDRIENIKDKHQIRLFRLDPRIITMLSTKNREFRLFTKRNDFPNFLIKILLTIEDRYFYKHNGIHFYSIGRAILANLSARRTVQGASTLTQQLVKNLFLNNKRSYWRKVHEAYMAILMNIRYSKDHILELYMNEVYLGQIGDYEIRGFPLASLYYFGRPIEELSIDQQALLVGMVKGASIYNPWKNPHLALKRRNLVLYLLKYHKIIDQKLYNILKIRTLGVRQRDHTISSQPAFMQILHQELQTKLNNKIENLSGIKIFTTFDFVIQHAAEKAVVEGIPILKKENNLKDLEIAMVVVDKCNGEIRAIIGGSEPKYAGYNRAIQARRAIGSLAKPAVYLAALSQPNKYRLNTWIADQPLYLYQSNGFVWTPQNEDRKFSGHVMLVDALTRSMNVPTVNLGIDIGLSKITDIWKRLGIPKNQLNPVPSIILGALNLTPLEVAQAFQTIASGGNRVLLSSLSSVIDKHGKILFQSYPQKKRVLPEQATYMTLWTMQQVIKRGTGRQLGEKYPYLHLAGKTGTTNNNIDTWFAGIDGREVLITWVGRDNNLPTKLYGASGAMLIYQRYLVNQSPIPLVLVPPKDIIDIGINEIGSFICHNSDKLEKLPVWITKENNICHNNFN